MPTHANQLRKLALCFCCLLVVALFTAQGGVIGPKGIIGPAGIIGQGTAAGGANPTFVQSRATTAGSTSLAYTSNVTAGNALYVDLYDGNNSGETLTFTDSQGNQWTTVSTQNLATGGSTMAIGCAIAGSSAADTVNFLVNGSSCAGSNCRAVMYEYSNATCTLDVTPAKADTTGATACNSGAVNTSTAKDLLIGGCSNADALTSLGTVGTGWGQFLTAGDAGFIWTQAETQVATNTGSYTVTTNGSFSSSGEQASILAPFRPVGSGGGSATFVNSAKCETNVSATCANTGLSIPSGDVIVVGVTGVGGSPYTVVDSNSDSVSCGAKVTSASNDNVQLCTMKAGATITSVTCSGGNGAAYFECAALWYTMSGATGIMDKGAGQAVANMNTWSSGPTATLTGSTDLVVTMWIQEVPTMTATYDIGTQRVLTNTNYSYGIADWNASGTAAVTGSGTGSLSAPGAAVVIAVK